MEPKSYFYFGKKILKKILEVERSCFTLKKGVKMMLFYVTFQLWSILLHRKKTFFQKKISNFLEMIINVLETMWDVQNASAWFSLAPNVNSHFYKKIRVFGCCPEFESAILFLSNVHYSLASKPGLNSLWWDYWRKLGPFSGMRKQSHKRHLRSIWLLKTCIWTNCSLYNNIHRFLLDFCWFTLLCCYHILFPKCVW